jgi:glutathione S-transferase
VGDPVRFRAIPRAEFDALKAAGALPMGQVPVLEAHGAKIYQSKAIARYVARKTGLLGASDEEAALIDAITETVGEIRDAINGAKDDAAKAEVLSTKVPALIAGLEKNIGAEGVAVGSKLSFADIVIAYYFTHANAPTAFGPGVPAIAELGKASAKISKIIAAVMGNAHVAAWEAGRAARGERF